MAGLGDTDIMLDSDWRIIPGAKNDVSLTVGVDCLMQDIRLEAVTQAGDLFYAPEWGWSLQNFIQSMDDPLTLIEIEQRVRTKLEGRDIIKAESIAVEAVFGDDRLVINTSFCFAGDGYTQGLTILLDRVNVEVTAL